MNERLRLDEMLVRRGLFATRSRARDAVIRGTVRIGDAIATKPGTSVSDDVSVEVDDPARRYVSRSALKLIAGLDHFGIGSNLNVAVDLGASTGGFTQVLLERGAKRVFAVDVGHSQFDANLAKEPRITRLDGVNARDLMSEHLDGFAPDLIVCDVSFISLTLALPAALDLAVRGACGVFLVKPQFEAGREAVGKGGMLRNPDDAQRIAEHLSAWLPSNLGWRSLGWISSPISGGDGNREFLLGGMKNG